jgi:metal-dependent amidase/aminoacylase/carboxypeptidase family protein
MRQHVKEEVRLHGIITRGGEASNIIPEETEIRYMARAKSRAVLDDAIEKVKRCIQAGAVGTGCSVEVEERKGYEATRHNSTLAAVLRDNYIRAGIEMAPEPRDGKGSTDLGDVSQVVPQACAYPAIAPSSVAGHSHEFAQAAASPDGHRVLLLSAKAIAWAAIDIMSDPAILDAAWKEFDSKE